MRKFANIQNWEYVFVLLGGKKLANDNNNAIRTNYLNAGIDKAQQNSRCRLCSDRDETINHIISEYSRLAQREYKTWHEWMGKGIH